ncbi:MAG: ethanolamine ammonia-lyase reactivating factor EutA [Telmatospirillum sp.]|nr:ethanolamine ammonia-lyase reactivating factor EutA [Telmatospirillum sp.]
MNLRELLSVGIDVGTTTTQVIFSRLTLMNRAAVSQVPRYEFIRRDIVWQSPVLFTPVDKDGHLREDDLQEMVLAQYRAASMDPDSIDSGAIIITGETAKTRNARPAVISLAQTLGDFVVATAGPHLESVIAGYGSGAQALSEQRMSRVLNIDIGGGTSNYVVFDAGRTASSACLNVGGRLFETDRQGRVTYVHAPGRSIALDLFGTFADPAQLSSARLRQVADRMAELLHEVIVNRPSPLCRQLLMTDPLPDCGELAAVTISGGVGECFAHPGDGDDFRFGDIGPLLAGAIRRNAGFGALPVCIPKQTVRATVIGAGAHTLSLSGSTIWLDTLTLPIRNIPVVAPATGDDRDIVANWSRSLVQMDLDARRDLYALALPPDLPVTYASVQFCVGALQGFAAQNPNPHPLLVIATQDFGKALGMLLRQHVAPRALAVIDEVRTGPGDYVDIGTPLFGGAVVPVTIKSLAFPS